jgi:uncharacterized membrane protein YjjP (DUF1212 family)
MREYMKSYIDEIDNYLKEEKKDNVKKVIEDHLIKISFFQHERFIHLCVTLSYAFFAIIFTALIALTWFVIPIAVIVYIFLLFYIFHYFFLENGVQYMYKQYDELKKLV